MTDDLKTRLRWAADNSDGCGKWNCDPADLDAAADRIEELEAKLRLARDAINGLVDSGDAFDDINATLAELTGEKP